MDKLTVKYRFLKTLLKRLTLALLLSLGLLVLMGSPLLLPSCASQSAPSGGPRDTLTPRLDTSYPPNNSVRFRGKEIELVFDEYLQVRGARQQVLISPPLENDLEIESVGKRIILRWEDSLAPQTTYIISFGQAITDLREGNVNDGFRYVFSTGEYLDSLAISGTVADAFTNGPEEKMLMALYRQDSSRSRQDSFLFTDLPNYYAYTDAEGAFSITNVKEGNYWLLGFADQRDDFRLNTGREKLAFWPHTISLPAENGGFYALQSFTPEGSFRFYRAKQTQKGEIQLAFNQVPNDSFRVELVSDVPADSGFFYPAVLADTISFWFRHRTDSLQFRLQGSGLDSIYTVNLRSISPPKTKLEPERNELRRRDTLWLRSNVPILGFSPKGVLRTAADTVEVTLQRDSLNPFRAFLAPPHPPKFALKFKAEALSAWYGPVQDSFVFNFTALKGEDLGSLSLLVRADSNYRYLLKLIEERSGRTVWFGAFRDSVKVELRQELPGKYRAFLTQDRNEDGEWTTGSFPENRLPEKRNEFPDVLEIRANWEVSLEWRLASGRRDSSRTE